MGKTQKMERAVGNNSRCFFLNSHFVLGAIFHHVIIAQNQLAKKDILDPRQRLFQLPAVFMFGKRQNIGRLVFFSISPIKFPDFILGNNRHADRYVFLF